MNCLHYFFFRKSSLNGCPGACPNEFDDQGRPYILTWKINDKECSNFTGIEAEEYCRYTKASNFSMPFLSLSFDVFQSLEFSQF